MKFARSPCTNYRAACFPCETKSGALSLLLQIIIDPPGGAFRFLERVKENDLMTGRLSLYEYRSVKEAMITLMWGGTFLDNVAKLFGSIYQVSWVMATFFILFIIMTNLTLLSMLIGILTEVISQKQAEIKETSVVRFLRDHLTAIYDKLDKSVQFLSGKEVRFLSRSTFRALLKDEDADDALAVVEIHAQTILELEWSFFLSSEYVPSSRWSNSDLGRILSSDS